MGVSKGTINNPNGRPAGTPNKATALAREAIASFVEGNVGRLNGFLDRIGKENPKAAFDCIMAVCEYHIPKLARSELIGDKDKPIEVHITTQSDQEIINRYLKDKSK